MPISGVKPKLPPPKTAADRSAKGASTTPASKAPAADAKVKPAPVGDNDDDDDDDDLDDHCRIRPRERPQPAPRRRLPSRSRSTPSCSSVPSSIAMPIGPTLAASPLVVVSLQGVALRQARYLRVADQGHSLTARHLLTLFDSVYLAALSTWIGGAIFFTFVLAPDSVQDDGAPNRRWRSFERFIRAITSAARLREPSHCAAFVAGPLCYHEYRGAMVGVQAMVIIGAILLMFYGGNSLTPAIRTAGRDGTTETAAARTIAAPRGGSQSPRLADRALAPGAPMWPDRLQRLRGSSN